MTKDYLKFEKVESADADNRTSRYLVINIKKDEEIGEIKWHGHWRQYCFFPDPESVWSAGCLEQISNFINNLMRMRKGLDYDTTKT